MLKVMLAAMLVSTCLGATWASAENAPLHYGNRSDPSFGVGGWSWTHPFGTNAFGAKQYTGSSISVESSTIRDTECVFVPAITTTPGGQGYRPGCK